MFRVGKFIERPLPRLRRLLRFLHSDERGQNTAEYIIITATVALIVGGVMFPIYGNTLTSVLGDLAQTISDAMP
jgi:hypothetical protein